MIIDWELGRLFIKMRDKFKNEKDAIEKVKDRYFSKICSSKVDTHFFVGTILEHNSWVVLGTFYPQKSDPNLEYEKSLLCHC